MWVISVSGPLSLDAFIGPKMGFRLALLEDDFCFKLSNIKMDLREIGWEGMDCNDLAEDRDQWRALVNMVMNLRVP
jgi:hypothetical protein